jgi:tetratricopeptide (TPR) repeat protein
LFLRGNQFLARGELDKATEYYNRVLDINPHHIGAQEKVSGFDTRIVVGDISLPTTSSNLIVEFARRYEASIAAKSLIADSNLEDDEALDYIERLKRHNYDFEKTNRDFREAHPSPRFKASTQKSGCYIATAVYGSYEAPQVLVLRRYRDDILRTTGPGRAFIRLYYAIGPTLATLIGHNTWLNTLIRTRLDTLVHKLTTP